MAKNKFEGMTTVDFLYRYVFRGIGYVFLAGVITGLILMVSQFLQLHKQSKTPAPTTQTHENGGRR